MITKTEDIQLEESIEIRKMNWEKQRQAFVAVNKRIVRSADAILNSVQSHDGDDVMEAGEKLIREYHHLLNAHPVNHINCVTMMHRLGRMVGTVNGLSASASPLIGRLAWRLNRHCHRLTPRQLSNIIWAMGNIGRRLLMVQHEDVSIPEFYASLFKRIIEIDAFYPQEISTIIHGLAKMSFRNKVSLDVLDHLTEIGIKGILDFKPQELAASLWGLGTLQYLPKNDFVRDVVWTTVDRLEQTSSSQMSNILWGAARLELRSIVQLLPKFERHFQRDLWNFNDQSLSIVLWALAKLNYAPGRETLEKAFRVIRSKIDQCSSRSIVSISYACAIFGEYPSEDDIDQLQHAFLNRMDDFSLQLTCIFSWSMAMMFRLDCPIFHRILDHITHSDWKTELTDADKRQLYQSMIHVQFFVPGGNEAIQHVSADLLSESRKAWEEGQRRKWRDTVCLSILVQLQKMGYIVKSQEEASKGLAWFAFDVVKKSTETTPIAVEVTIPMHQFRNDKMRIEGPRRWAMQLMRKRGFRVLQVDAEKWKMLESDDRMAYLTVLLEGIKEKHVHRTENVSKL